MKGNFRFVPYALAVFALVLIVVIASNTNLFGIVTGPTAEEKNKLVNNVSLKITSPDWTFDYLNIDTNNATVADFLFECAEIHGFKVRSHNFSGYNSRYITSINGIKEGGIKEGTEGRYWQYYVNGEYADVGCSKYVLNDNDLVEWKFEPNPWS